VSEPRQPKSQSPKTQQRSHSPKLQPASPKKNHSLQGFRFTKKTFKITQNQTIETHTVYRSRVKYIPSAQRDETSREAKRRDEAAKKEKQNNGEREREIGERRVLLESSVAKERSRRSIIVGQKNVGQKKKE
jgi:hypothetical protein